MQSTRQTVGASNEVHVTVQPKEGNAINFHTNDGDAGTNIGINALATSTSAKPTTTATITGTADVRMKNPA